MQTITKGWGKVDFDPGILAEAMVRLRRALSDKGLHIEFLSDIHEYKEKVERARSLQVDPQFSPDLFDFHPENFFGLLLIDDHGDTVSGQAMRLERLGKSNLVKILKNQQQETAMCFQMVTF